jgi:hypothetical protein
MLCVSCSLLSVLYTRYYIGTVGLDGNHFAVDSYADPRFFQCCADSADNVIETCDLLSGIIVFAAQCCHFSLHGRDSGLLRFKCSFADTATKHNEATEERDDPNSGTDNADDAVHALHGYAPCNVFFL